MKNIYKNKNVFTFLLPQKRFKSKTYQSADDLSPFNSL